MFRAFNPRNYNRGYRGGRRDGIALFLLASELMRNYQHLPIVTLSTIVGQILIYLKMIPFLPWAREHSVCVSLYKVLAQQDYSKIFISQIEHADDWHLYYNMVSFMNKSKSLEIKFGPVRYILLLLLFTISTGLTYLGLNYCLLEVTQDQSYVHRCAVGFSGVIFALKVLTTHYWPNEQSRTFYMMGLPFFSTGNMNSKYMVWVELAVISLISPNASFVGHLAGILVGLAYIYGPLQWVLDAIYSIIAPVVGPRPFQFAQTQSSTGYQPRRAPRESNFYQTRSQTSGGASRPAPATSDNLLSEEEQIRRATEESLREYQEQRSGQRHYGFESLNAQAQSRPRPSAPPPPPPENNSHQRDATPTALTAEELRQRRLRRFGS